MTQPITVEAPDLADAYRAGFQDGRRRAAADIRARQTARTPPVKRRHLEMAARIAESGK